MIWHDNGYGITQDSLAFFRQYRGVIGDILAVHMLAHHDDGAGGYVKYRLRVKGADGEVWLSGCDAGYSSDASKATVRVLRELGYPPQWAMLALEKDAFALGPPDDPELVEEETPPVDWDLSLPALAVLEAIQELHKELGRLPKVREISDRAGYRSPSGAYWRIEELEKAGKLKRGGRRGGLRWFEGMGK